MKSFRNYLFEARTPAPSALKKFKQGSREVTNTYIAGDIYDLSGDNTYKQKDSYYEGNGDGYIMDKAGNVYDVSCYEGTGDAGRIVGGSSSKSLTISKAGPDGQNLRFSGYSAVFSRPSSETWGSIISDIKNGIYLEDYLLKHANDLQDYNLKKSDWFKEKTKDADGKTMADRKHQKKIENELSFNQKYCVITDYIAFNDEGGRSLKFAYKDWAGEMDNRYQVDKIIGLIMPSSTKNAGKNSIWSSDKGDPAEKVPTEVNNEIIESFKTLALEAINKVFGGVDTKGFNFKFSISFEGKQKYGGPHFAWDIKKKRFVIIDLEKRKVLDRVYELRLATVTIDKEGKCSDFGNKLKKDICKYFLKELGSESKYVNDHYKAVAWGNGYWKPEMSKGEAKEKCKKEFSEMKRKKEYNENTPISASVETLAIVMEKGNYQKLIAKGVSKPADEPTVDEIGEITNGPDKPSSTGGKSAEETYGKAYGPAKEKMEKWHAGTRKQNLKNCNDGKLRMNFAICKELGYEDECKQIADEAKKRGIVLESRLSLGDMIQAIFS